MVVFAFSKALKILTHQAYGFEFGEAKQFYHFNSLIRFIIKAYP
jgi:hypothetical protein